MNITKINGYREVVPRNIYLAQGRKVSMDHVNKVIDDFCKPTFQEKCIAFYNKILKKIGLKTT